MKKTLFIEAGQTNKVTFDLHVKMLRKMMKIKQRNKTITNYQEESKC